MFGILSFKHTINKNDIDLMNIAVKKDDYHIYKDEHYFIATTQQVTNDGKYAYCGRVRNMTENKLFDCFEKNKVNLFDGHFLFFERRNNCFKVYKDALGIEPFYYYFKNDTLYFASEMKILLCLENNWIVTKDGLMQALALLPALDCHTTPYQGIYHLGPGEYLQLNDYLYVDTWWKIKDQPINKDIDTIISDVRNLVETSILQDMSEDASCMLSGGLDSSIITAVVASKKNVNTYDVVYEEDEQYFKAYDYQTTMDKPFIEDMKDMYPLNHTTIQVNQNDLSQYLNQTLFLRDVPGMVDIDSSLYLFLKQLKEKVILSGECADEFFAGYPWFYKEELQNTPYFPWTRHVKEKNDLIRDEIDISHYLTFKKEETFLNMDFTNEKNRFVYLTMQWFMQTLVIRGDVIGRECDIDIRMPFASKPLFEYLWNIQSKDFKQEKYLLREAFKGVLPNSIYQRKKNPYPKTHHPKYVDDVCQLLKEALDDKTSILHKIFKTDKLYELIKTKGASFEYPWYGQLMMGPQLIAFIYLFHIWEKTYPITIEI